MFNYGSMVQMVAGKSIFQSVTLQFKVSKGAKFRNRYNQVPHLTQDTNGKVTNSQNNVFPYLFICLEILLSLS